MKKNENKLALRKMTVRALTPNQLEEVAGGGQTGAYSADTCPHSLLDHCRTL